mmetsp:Transcript_38852/g.107008  ORF Transcript_38852/g.107008 Transcript_38852/m.107008 type:complete len:276 (+) Transcript_38852:709-1536(+)
MLRGPQRPQEVVIRKSPVAFRVEQRNYLRGVVPRNHPVCRVAALHLDAGALERLQEVCCIDPASRAGIELFEFAFQRPGSEQRVLQAPDQLLFSLAQLPDPLVERLPLGPVGPRTCLRLARAAQKFAAVLEERQEIGRGQRAWILRRTPHRNFRTGEKQLGPRPWKPVSQLPREGLEHLHRHRWHILLSDLPVFGFHAGAIGWAYACALGQGLLGRRPETLQALPKGNEELSIGSFRLHGLHFPSVRRHLVDVRVHGRFSALWHRGGLSGARAML